LHAEPFISQGADLRSINARIKKGMEMKIFLLVLILMTVCLSFSTVGAEENTGEALFNQHCVACHPGGGNIMNPQKTLHSGDLTANNIAKPEDIVAVMRNPGPGMPKFDKEKIPDNFAERLAEYILKTFK
jgi:cytochrome c6